MGKSRAKKLSGKVYDTDYIYKISEGLSYRLFGPIFTRLSFSHIQITIASFFLCGLTSVYFFSLGTHVGYLTGLGLSVVYSILDWMDGFVAKSRGISSVMGAWLDPALDFIWQNALVAALILGVYISKGQSYSWLVVGLFTLVSLVVANHIGEVFRDRFDFKFRSALADFRKGILKSKKIDLIDLTGLEILAPTHFIFNFLFTIRYPLVLGALINRMDLVMILLLITQGVRAVTLYLIYALYLNRAESYSKRVILRALEAREIKPDA